VGSSRRGGAEQRRAGRSGVEAAFGGAGWTRRWEERGGVAIGSGAESGGPGAGDVLFLVSFSHLLVINKLKFSHNF
jgi:hypothetical protein